MTLGDLVGLAWRQRALALVCIVLTGAACFLLSAPVEAWNARVSVVLLVPRGTPGNPLASTTLSLIAATGLVARDVNGAGAEAQTVSSDLDLASTDSEPGWSLRQPSAGGQWNAYFQESRLDVKAWGHTRGEAELQMNQALAAVNRSLTDLQDRRGVGQSQRIELTLSPEQPVYTIQAGSRIRVVGGTALAGLTGTVGAIVLVERRGRRRRVEALLSTLGQPESKFAAHAH